MAGLVEKAEDVLDEVNRREDASADLALIVAAQKFEHYEISAYRTARTMAGQSGLPAVAELLDRSLAEEEMADHRLTLLARGLMSGSTSGTPV
jgi:Mn-containing catalase